MEPKRPDQRDEDEQKKKNANPNEIDENRRAAELEESDDVEEVVGPQPGGGEESGHS